MLQWNLFKGYIENTVVKPNGFSRRMYMLAGNMNWAPQAKQNGIKKKDIKSKIV
ncbi:MAG: hypothetical protein UD936_11490 [Acutalibacteraceae bacterium]|nr:hypothetical protein [Acutalibacteraceae bacterium]